MSLEAGNYISDLVVTNPLAGDPRSEGDDHLRLLKFVLKTTFPGIAGAVTPTHTELNFVDGVTSPIQTQLDALSSGKASMPAGTVCPFFQAAAPLGWTQVTTHNNKALRVVSGAGGGSGGSVAFTTAFASKTPAGVIGGTALTAAQLPAHTHTYKDVDNTGTPAGGSYFVGSVGNITTENTGSGNGLLGQTHTHTFTGTAMNLAVQYIDVIIASRN